MLCDKKSTASGLLIYIFMKTFKKIADIRTPVCAVTGAQYLTKNGWSDLRNPIDTDYPFRMFRDEGRTFLQVSPNFTI